MNIDLSLLFKTSEIKNIFRYVSENKNSILFSKLDLKRKYSDVARDLGFLDNEIDHVISEEEELIKFITNFNRENTLKTIEATENSYISNDWTMKPVTLELLNKILIKRITPFYLSEDSYLNEEDIHNLRILSEYEDLEDLKKLSEHNGIYFRGIVYDLDELYSSFGSKPIVGIHIARTEENISELDSYMKSIGIPRLFEIKKGKACLRI